MGSRLQMHIQNLAKHLRWSLKQKVNGFYLLTISAKHSILGVAQDSDYASGFLTFFAVVLRGTHQKIDICNMYATHTYSLQTKNFPLFWGHTCKYNIQAKEKAINHWIWCFCVLFYFLHLIVPDNKCDKQKWYVLFPICIKTVVNVLACARAITHIKWRRLPLSHKRKEML